MTGRVLTLRLWLCALALPLAPGLALAESTPLAGDTTSRCAAMAPSYGTPSPALLRLSEVVAQHWSLGPAGQEAEAARLVLRLCFTGTPPAPEAVVIAYEGAAGETEALVTRHARSAVIRAINSGALEAELAELGLGQGEKAVVDLVFGPHSPPGRQE